MLTEHHSGGKTVWVDIFNPTREENSLAPAPSYQLDILPREELSEIDLSSRLHPEDGSFIISVLVTLYNARARKNPRRHWACLPTKDPASDHPLCPASHSFEGDHRARLKRRERSPADIFLVILEAVIDYGADRLEELRAEALGISQRIFHKEMQEQQTYNAPRVNRMPRDTLVEIGDMGGGLSYIRDTLLGYFSAPCRSWQSMAQDKGETFQPRPIAVRPAELRHEVKFMP